MTHDQPTSANPDAFRRSMLMVIIAMAVLGTLLAWYIMAGRGLDTPAVHLTLGVSTVALFLLLLATWLRLLPQRVVEFLCLIYGVGVGVACMLLRLYWPHLGGGVDLEPLYLWLPVFYVFAFVMTDHRTGLVVSLGVMALFVAVSLPYLIRDADGTYANITVQMLVVSAAMIATLYFFSGYQHRLRLAQARADQLAELTQVDDLTGLTNRRGMAAQIAAGLKQLEQGAPRFALVLFDVDRFKAINDRSGHAAGDHALVALAGRTSPVLRDIGTLGRWGGDEFVALIRDSTTNDPIHVADALRAAVAAEPGDGDRRLTISCGVTVAKAGDSLDGLLQRADAALYAAKRAGRNRVESVLESR